MQAFTDDTLTTCPECSGPLRKLFNSVGVVFKGSGFYRTDSRASGNGSSNGEKAAGSQSSTGSKSEGDSNTSTDKPAKDSAPKDKTDKAAKGKKDKATATTTN